jgi:hypothetical protein
VPCDVLEGLGDLVAFFESALRFAEFGLESAELHRDLGLLLGEQVGTDPIGVVQVEQLATLLLEIGHECVGPVRTPAGSRPGRPPQLGPDRLLQTLIATHQAEPEERSTLDPIDRPPRLIAALAPMHTPEESTSLAVPIDTRHSATQPAPHDPRQRMATLATTALHPPTLRPLPLLLGD